jgi:cyclophilin family peptidyl-prolyl cis-trans isomerase
MKGPIMPLRIVVALACFLALSALPAAAQRPAGRPAKPADAAAAPAPPTKPGSAAEEFYRLNTQRKEFLAKLAELKVKYQSAGDEQRAGIEAQWKQYVAEGDKIREPLLAAAEKAYAEAPNTDPQITDFLVTVLRWNVQRDNYEPAARIGKLLMEHQCEQKRVPLLAGLAALMTADYDAAQRYLEPVFGKVQDQQAARQLLDRLVEVLMQDPREREATEKRAQPTAALVVQLLQDPDSLKKNWAKERLIREDEAKTDNLPRVLLKTTKGDIELELFENEAPNTVANFISLVESGLYKDTPFHRVLPGFMAQGGDPKGNGSGGPGYNIPCECYEPNHRLHFRGSLSMAHAGRDTGGSQFFLTFIPTVHLDGHHTVFGRVIGGMDVLAKLQRRDPEKDTEVRPDKILDAKVIRKRPHEYKPKKMPE